MNNCEIPAKYVTLFEVFRTYGVRLRIKVLCTVTD